MSEPESEAQIDDLLGDLEALRAELAGLRLTWTSERPTVPGWYWTRRRDFWVKDGPGLITEIRQDAIGMEWREGMQFAGPIREPAEPAEAS